MHEGTVVRVRLRISPYALKGLFSRSYDERLAQLTRRLVLENAVPIHTWEPKAADPEILPPFSLATGSSEEVFDRLYPPQAAKGRAGEEKFRLRMRDDFVSRATEVRDDKGQRIGIAMLWSSMAHQGQRDYPGIVTVNGFRSDASVSFAGYLAGQPSRASRDKAALIADRSQMQQWMRSQQQRLRDADLFDDSLQLELAYALHCALHPLADDIAFALTAEGVLRLSDVPEWAGSRTDIFVGFGWPLAWRTRPPQLTHRLSGERARIPDNYIFIFQYGFSAPLSDAFPPTTHRDSAYEFARDHATLTWQKYWWRTSGDLYGLFIRTLCEVWSCTLESLLAPLERRDWSDSIDVDGESLGSVPGHRLRRPPHI